MACAYHPAVEPACRRSGSRAPADVHLLRVRAYESCGGCFPCRIGLAEARDVCRLVRSFS